MNFLVFYAGNPKDGRCDIEEIAKILQNVKATLNAEFTVVETYITYVTHLVKSESYRKAIFLVRACLENEMLTRISDVNGFLCLTLATIYKEVREYDKALPYAKTSLDVSIEIGDKKSEAQACFILGEIYDALNDYANVVKFSKHYISIVVETGHWHNITNVFCCLASAQHKLGNYSNAIDYQTQALQVSKEIGDEAGMAVSCMALGRSLTCIGEYRKATEYFEQGLKFKRGALEEKALQLSDLAKMYNKLHEFSKAVECSQKHLNIAKAFGNKGSEAESYAFLGCAYLGLSENANAVKCYERLLVMAEDTEKREQLLVSGHLAVASLSLGYYKKSIHFAAKQLRIALEVGDKPQECLSYKNLSYTFQQLGDYSTAMSNLENELCLCTELNNKLEECRAISDIAIICLATEDIEKAVENFTKSLNLALALGDKVGQARAYHGLGLCYDKKEDYKAAISHLEHCLAMMTEVGYKAVEAMAYSGLANVYHAKGDYLKSLCNASQALDIEKQCGKTKQLLNAYMQVGRSFLNLGVLEGAALHFESYVQLFEEIECDLGSKESLRITIANEHITAYKSLSTVFLKQEEEKQALFVSDRGRARALTTLLMQQLAVHSNKVKMPGTEVLQIAKKLNSTVLFYSLCDKSKNKCCEVPVVWIVGPSDERAVELSITVDIDIDDLCSQNLRKEISKKKNMVASSMIGSNAGFQTTVNNSLFEMVDEGNQTSTDLKAEESDAGEQNHAIVEAYKAALSPCGEGVSAKEASIAPNENTKHSLASVPCLSCSDIEQNNGKTKQNKASSIPAEKRNVSEEEVEFEEVEVEDVDEETFKARDRALRALYNDYFLPAQSFVNTKEVIIVPDEKLHRVPFAAMITEKAQHLCEFYKFRYVPSITAAHLISQRATRVSSFPNDILIVGDPHPTIRLPGARREALEIASMFSVRPLLGCEATKQQVLMRMKTAAIVHISAHGSTELGEIFLSPTSSKHSQLADCLLTVREVQETKLQTKLTVLSTCNSGRGKVGSVV